jgi:hypothetical protein
MVVLNPPSSHIHSGELEAGEATEGQGFQRFQFRPEEKSRFILDAFFIVGCESIVGRDWGRRTDEWKPINPAPIRRLGALSWSLRRIGSGEGDQRTGFSTLPIPPYRRQKIRESHWTLFCCVRIYCRYRLKSQDEKLNWRS